MTPILTDPPDPHPKKPRLICPAGATDCHLHIFGPRDRFPFVAGSKYVSEDRSPEEVFALQQRLGFARSVFVSGGGYGPTTAQLEYVMADHGDRLVGVALMPEDSPPAEFQRLGKLGVCAVRFVNPAHGGRLPPISRTNAQRAVDAGWHIHYYAFREELAEDWQRLLTLPGTVVLDHFAHIPAAQGVNQPAMTGLLKLLDTGRFWVKLSGPMRLVDGDMPYEAVTPLARALVAHRPDRLVWGTDWPHVNLSGRRMPNDADLLDLLLDWVPDVHTRDRILSANPVDLFGPVPAADKPA